MSYPTRAGYAPQWNAAAYNRARRAANLTFAELARRLDTTTARCHAWATGRPPRVGEVARIAAALRVPQKALVKP